MSRGRDDKKGAKKRSSGKFDPFIGSKSVEGLDNRNFDDFLNERDITMVMFYDASDAQCEWSKKHFLKASKTTHRINHGYGAVDCVREADLCAQEGISFVPSFKLFVGNKVVDTYSTPREMTHLTIKKFMENMKFAPKAPPCERPCEKERNVCTTK